MTTDEQRERTFEDGPPSPGAIWNKHYEEWEERPRLTVAGVARHVSDSLLKIDAAVDLVASVDRDWSSSIFESVDVVAFSVARELALCGMLDVVEWARQSSPKYTVVDRLADFSVRPFRLACFEHLDVELDALQVEAWLRPIMQELARATVAALMASPHEEWIDRGLAPERVG